MGKRDKSVQKSAFFKFDVGLGKKKKETANARPKISSNRITVLPGFLSQGVKAVTAKKEEEENRRNENILKGNLHGLLFDHTEEKNSLRRSARISKKDVVNYAEITPKKRKYPRQGKLTVSKTPEHRIPNYKTEDVKYTLFLGKTVETNQKNSKSLFKKIISSQTLSDSIYFVKSFFSDRNQSGVDFNKNVLNKIQIDFKIDVAEGVREKIFEEIETVNDILSGKIDPSMGSFFKLAQAHMEDAEHQVPEFLFSSRDWQFATPPSQKLNITFYEESSIQPAILCNDGTARNIYQLKKEINSNMINHINPDSIEVDNRYMEQIAEFDKENRPVRTFNLNTRKTEDKRENFDFKPNFLNKYLKEHMSTIQSRPKKTVKRLRFAETYKKSQMSLEFSKPSTSALYDPLAMETSELDFTYVKCLKGSDSSESPKSCFRMAPRVDIFECSDSNDEFFSNSSSDIVE